MAAAHGRPQGRMRGQTRGRIASTGSSCPRYHRHVPERSAIPTSPGSDPVPAEASGSAGAKAPARGRKPASRTRKGSAPPVLVEVRRGETVESRHRGHIVQVDAHGKVLRAVGAPSTDVMMRSTVKPFGVVALIESGAADDLALTPSELAIMCASHTGEDKHVRTLQAIFRRASVTQSLLQCGAEGAPSDALTANRLARDGETPGPVRQGCSGFHAASILMSSYAGWSVENYADPKHPSQVAVRETVAKLLGRKLETLRTASDNCGVLTYEVTLLELARAFLLLADPEGPAVDEARAESAPALMRVRDAMMGSPDMVGGTYDNLDTELMRCRPGRLVAKAGADGMRAIGLVATDGSEASGIAIKIEDGDMSRRAIKATSVETLAQVGLLDERDLRAMAAYHHPTVVSPDGTEASAALPRFELAAQDKPAQDKPAADEPAQDSAAQDQPG
jgi:L-asparaginase II